MTKKELERRLKNALAGLTCGNHPGMSCVEAHEDDAIELASVVDETKHGWYVRLGYGQVKTTLQLKEAAVYLDLDSTGQFLGLEILKPVNLMRKRN